MTWRTQYLANLMRVVESDALIDNREFLALCEIEREIKAKIDHYINARNRIRLGGDARPFKNGMLNERHLVDLYTLAMADQKLSRLELEMIERFVDRSEVPAHIAARCRALGEAKAAEIYAEITDA